MGIVTWASVKCELLPELRELFLVPAKELGDLIDFAYRLLRFRFGEELFIVNGACLAYILSRRSDEAQPLKDVLPAWTAIVGIAGGHILPRERVQAQEQDIRDLAQQFGLAMVPAIPGCRGGELLELLSRPSGEPYWRLRYKGGSQDLFFLTTLEKTPAYLTTIASVAGRHQYPAADIGVYIQPVHQGVGCHCEFMLPFDRRNGADRLRTREFFRDASLQLFRQGAYFSRPYGIWAGLVYNADAQTTIATRKVKGIFDPNNVMNPGKLCF
jgi:FAD/FMN-containing dehydrogenase